MSFFATRAARSGRVDSRAPMGTFKSSRAVPTAPKPDPAAQLSQIAKSAVQLAALGPRLATLAGSMEEQAQKQANSTALIASMMEALAHDLDRAVVELRSSSGQMQEALGTVERIADHTRLLSFNAAIEAARAGAQGAAFAVVVDEVKRLAEGTGQATRLIDERMDEIAGSVARVEAVTSVREDAPDSDTRTVQAMKEQVRGVASSAEAQLASAASVHAMGDHVNRLTESLLLAVGTFRFEAHTSARMAVESFVPKLARDFDDRTRLEDAIGRWLRAHPHFELAYLTDARGRQIVDNLGLREDSITRDPAGFGRDWSDRPWYRAALDHSGACPTDVYRSTATGDFCFTIAMALRDETGQVLGVFGSDVNFQRLVSQ